jgi:asparagine synthase (glutamine-hydrolysing)
MAHSIEIRSPFLDWNFFQYAMSLPGEAKIETGKNKSILRESFEKDLPEEIKNIKFKQGLPATDIKIDAKSLMVIKNIVNSGDFKTSSHWNGKKILKDFNSQPDVNNISEIWKLVRLHLMDKGFKERKKETSLNKIKSKEKFNILN